MEKSAMKRFLNIFLLPFTLLLTTQVWAGTVNLNGSLTVSTNVTAQSITLGGVPQSNWPASFSPGVVLSNGVLDTSLSQFYTITLTSNITWSFENHSIGRAFWLKVLQGSTGGWTNSWDPNVMWVSHLPPQTSTTSNDWDLFQFVDDGTYWSGMSYGISYTTNLPDFALLFNGAGNYAQSTAAFSETITNYTIECWFIGNSTSGENPVIIGTLGDDIGYNSIADILVNNGDTTQLSLGTRWDVLSASTNVLDGVWHHVAGVWDGSQVRLYLDGNEIASEADSQSSFTWQTPLRLAYRDTNGGCFFGGTIDEVRISSIARYSGSSFTPATSFTNDSETIVYWTCNDGRGGTVTDATGNHNGTLYGSPLPTWVAGR
jgi:hypothetical protein